MKALELIVNQTHRGLKFVDGAFVAMLDPGHYRFPRGRDWLGRRRPDVSVTLVDLREREINIKGQEILTSDKVAIRVNIIVQFRVTDAKAAVLEVADYEGRLYSDVQLSARRSLAAMKLEEILTYRNKLSEDILGDVKEIAAHYGVLIFRADVKDLVFPGNLQDIMNKVLAAERVAQAQLIEARTRAQAQQIEAQAFAEARRIRNEADRAVLEHPLLLRLRELEAMAQLAQSANANLYIDFQKRPPIASE
jgi:regulator of protease activity HflC (stomatin/prohibitin superfamily)